MAPSGSASAKTTSSGVHHFAILPSKKASSCSFVTSAPGFFITTIVADAASTHAKKGFVTDHLTAADLWDGVADVYLCGPPPMVEAVRDHMKGLGITPASFLFEKFNPSEAKAAA